MSIIAPREQWIITNLTDRTLPVNDIANFPAIRPRSTFNAIQYTNAEVLGSSLVLKNYVRQRFITFGTYLHTHDDKVNVADLPSGLDVVTGGPDSDADLYHTHKNKSDVGHTHEQYIKPEDFSILLSHAINLDDISYKSLGINQFGDLNSTGEQIDSTVAASHAELHTISSHIDTVATGNNLNILVGGSLSNADSLHSHKLVGGATDVIATYIEINRALSGISNNVTSENLNILTGGPLSFADHLHSHASSAVPDHNDLNDLQGGDPSLNDFYHLSLAEYIGLTQGNNADALHTHTLISGATDVVATAIEINQSLSGISANVTFANLNILTGGPLSVADSLHTHSASSLPDHNDLNGLQGGDPSLNDFYHISNDKYDLLNYFVENDVDNWNTAYGWGDHSPIFTALSEPTGFQNRHQSTISFVDGSRTFSISPTGVSYNIWFQGNVVVIDAIKNIIISDVEGLHYIYFDDDGELYEAVNPVLGDAFEIIVDKVFISIIYWNATDKSSVYVGEERHGCIMDGITHVYLHYTRGLQWVYGLGLGDFSIGNGSLDAHAQFSVEAGAVSDEDLGISISTIASTVGLPILYRLGASGYWRRLSQPGFACYRGGNTRLSYNQFTGGAWQLTQVDNNNFVLYHIFATTDKDTPMFSVMGQNQYGNQPAARNGAQEEISSLLLGELPTPEIRPIGTVIFQTRNGYGNTVNARILMADGTENYVDWRTNDLPRGTAPTAHGNLTGLLADDHPQYVLADGTRDVTGSLAIYDGIYIGATNDAHMYYDGTDFNIDLDDPSIGGVIKLNDDVEILGKLSVDTRVGTIVLETGSIVDSSGAINFANNELTTTGKIYGGLDSRFGTDSVYWEFGSYAYPGVFDLPRIVPQGDGGALGIMYGGLYLQASTGSNTLLSLFNDDLTSFYNLIHNVTTGDLQITSNVVSPNIDLGSIPIVTTGTGTFGTITDGTASLNAGSLTSVKLGSLTNNGFVTTSGGDGSLSIDTNTYLTTTDAGTTYVPYMGGTSSVVLLGYSFLTDESVESPLIKTNDIEHLAEAGLGINFNYIDHGGGEYQHTMTSVLDSLSFFRMSRYFSPFFVFNDISLGDFNVETDFNFYGKPFTPTLQYASFSDRWSFNVPLNMVTNRNLEIGTSAENVIYYDGANRWIFNAKASGVNRLILNANNLLIGHNAIGAIASTEQMRIDHLVDWNGSLANSTTNQYGFSSYQTLSNTAHSSNIYFGDLLVLNFDSNFNMTSADDAIRIKNNVANLNQSCTGNITSLSTTTSRLNQNRNNYTGTVTTFNAFRFFNNKQGTNNIDITNFNGVRLDAVAFTGTTNIGINIGGVTGATNNYAIYTNEGLVRLGDDVYLHGTNGLYFNDTNTEIWEDGSGNLTFKDANAGTLTLSEMATPKLIYMTGEVLLDGVMTDLSDAINWNTNKSVIKAIKIQTDSTEWDLEIWTNALEAPGGIYNDGNIVVAKGLSGDNVILLDVPYIDDDDANEVHLKFTDVAGDGATYLADVYGEMARS